MGGWVGEWLGGWMDGWEGAKAGLKIAYSHHKSRHNLFFPNFSFFSDAVKMLKDPVIFNERDVKWTYERERKINILTKN